MKKQTFKKSLIAALVLLLGVTALVGCGSDDEPAEDTEVETVEEPATDEETDLEITPEETNEEDENENQDTSVGENELENQITTVVEMLLNDWVDVLVTYEDNGELSTVFLSSATYDFTTLVSLAQEDAEIAETLLRSIVTVHSTLRDVYDIEVQVVMMDISGNEDHVVFFVQADGTMVNGSLATE